MIRYFVRCVPPILFFLVSMILVPPRSAALCGQGQICGTKTIPLSTGYVSYYSVYTPKTCVVRGKYTYHYDLTNVSQFVYNPPSGGQIPINDASGFPISFSITQASPGPNYPPCPTNGVHGPPGTLLDHNYQVYVYADNNSLSIKADYASGTFGYINPKYVVTDVRYAPPGSKSTAVYTNSTTVSSTLGLSSTFSTSYTVATSVTVPISAFFDGQGTNSYSSTLTQQSTNGYSTTLTRTDTNILTTPGPASDYIGLDHSYDMIDVWINPVMLFSVYRTNVAGETSVGFFGYGSSALDPTAPIDIWPIPAGCLNGDFAQTDTACSTPLNQFARTWAANEVWPSGQGPGLTQTDLNNILAADPWGSCTHNSIQGSVACPTYSTPGFVLANFSLSDQQNITYIQPAPGGQPSGYSHGVSTTSAATNTSQLTNTQSQTWGYEQHFQGGTFLSDFIFDSKEQYTISSSYTFNSSLTRSGTTTGTANITGPACVGNPCNPSYPPSPDTLYGTAVSFDLFIDARFGTFVFLPSAY